MCTVVMFCLWWAALAVGGFCNGHNDPVFHVNGQPLEYQFIEGDTFLLTCGGIALDDPALPRFAPALRVLKVRLDGCWPRAGSYAAALRALNVTAHDAPALGIAPTYFVDLKLTKVKDFNVSVLAAVPTLCNLTISDTTLTSADFAQLPVGLERLNLNNTKTGHLSSAALARLPRLYELAVFDSKPMQVEAVGNLTSLVVNSCATTVTMSLSDTLRSLELWSWAARHPEPWLSCTSLKFLALYQFAAESLPDGWLTHCQQMSSLRIEGANKLSTLAAGVLRGAKALQKVKIWGTALEALPAGLLDDAPELRELDLSSNRLHTLPSDLFQRSKYLSQLDLSSNKLARSVLEVVGAATSLTELNLNDNTALDACCNATHVSSPLRDMSRLGVLSLRSTGTRCVCASWRQLPRLKRLDLLETKVTRLNFIDMQFRRVVFNLTLVVSAVGLSLQRQDYYNANFVLFKRPTLTLDLRGALRCDCELYWAAVLLGQFGNRVQQVGGTCTYGRALEDVPLDDLVCAAPGPCAEGCACSTREEVTGRVLRLDCSKAGLTAVPRIEARAALQNTGLGRLKVVLHFYNTPM